MEKDVQERFERIEENLKRVAQRLEAIAEAHQELEGAQKNTLALLNRFIEESTERGRAIDERITKLTIQVDRLVAKDLEDTL
jgi:hypothetical protein